MNIKQAIIEAVNDLKSYDIEDSVNIARILMCFTIDKPKEYIIINDKEILSNEIIEKYNSYIEKIKNGYPLQYITNQQEFMKLNFYVDENVLIPQPDTEILVEEVINISKSICTGQKIQALDLCTGSGAIAISMKKYINNIEVTATDISNKALKVAQMNAKYNNVDIKLIESDMFNNVRGKYDIIISNPPYIERETIKLLPMDVQHEPIIALDGGTDGLDFYRKISDNAYKYLNRGGYLILEIGYNQKESVIEILKNKQKYNDIKCIKDLSNNDRVISARLK